MGISGASVIARKSLSTASTNINPVSLKDYDCSVSLKRTVRLRGRADDVNMEMAKGRLG